MFNSKSHLDPVDWDQIRSISNRMVNDILNHLATIETQAVWKNANATTETAFQGALPSPSRQLDDVHESFLNHILPYSIGNAHPGFLGWVHGGGTVVGMLADMLASGLNANLGGRDHIPIAVEQQVVAWMRELFEYPESASGLFVTGSSMANAIGVMVARTKALGVDVRKTGMQGVKQRLTAYTSTAAHRCVSQALEMTGIGSDYLRLIPTNSEHQIRLDALQQAIDQDRRDGHLPFCIIGTSGTVDTGAIDDLKSLSEIAKREGIWFHVDGACGALGRLSKRFAPLLDGIQYSDSIALDFHKWAQVPYDAGFILVRDSVVHKATFASPAAYLRREQRGMAAGDPWPCDYGPDLSRSFKALKVWFTFQVYGADRIGQMMDHTTDLAHELARRITKESELELLAPVVTNIVCFRYRCDNSNETNAEIVIRLQESGIVAPSSTTINGTVAIRAAFFNHRTTEREVNLLIEETLRHGRDLAGKQ